MAVTRLTQTRVTSFTKFRSMLAGSSRFIDSDYELIQTQVLATPVISISFNSLGTYSSIYKHLQVRFTARSARVSDQDFTILNFNSDLTSGFYSQHTLRGNGTTVVSSSSVPNSSVFTGGIPDATAAAGLYAGTVIDILDAYSTTKNTTVRVLSGWNGGSAGDTRGISLYSGAYFKTDAINRIELKSIISNFVAGSRFSLYGIKG